MGSQFAWPKPHRVGVCMVDKTTNHGLSHWTFENTDGKVLFPKVKAIAY